MGARGVGGGTDLCPRRSSPHTSGVRPSRCSAPCDPHSRQIMERWGRKGAGQGVRGERVRSWGAGEREVGREQGGGGRRGGKEAILYCRAENTYIKWTDCSTFV